MPRPKSYCRIDGCDQPCKGGGLCAAHYLRQRRHGDPLAGRRSPRIFASPVEAFEAYVQKGADCWRWTGPLYPEGYAYFDVAGVRYSAHRWSYEHYEGPIPDGLTIDHLCMVKACVKPSHLEPVTQKVNNQRRSAAYATGAKQ